MRRSELIGLYWKVIGWIVVLGLVFSVYLGLAAVLVASMSGAPFAEFFKSQEFLKSIPLLVLAGLGYLAFALAMNIVIRVYLVHGDVEMLNTGCDIGHDSRELRLAVGTGAVGEHPHRRLVFADAVDAPGKMIFRAEGDLQKAFDDLAVGEDLLLGALALRDCRNFRDRRRRHRGFAECDCGEGRRQGPDIQ